jgi:hypothetical protein
VFLTDSGEQDEPDEPEFNVSRLYRDAAANVIWEGTTNVLASETMRHLVNKDNLDIFDGWMGRTLQSIKEDEVRAALSAAWLQLWQRFSGGKERMELLLGEGREVMFGLAWVVGGMLLAHDAQRDGNPEAQEVARRWVLHGEGGVGEFVLGDVVAAARRHANVLTLENRAEWDCRLVWGIDLKGGVTGYRKTAKASLDPRGDSSQMPSQ